MDNENKAQILDQLLRGVYRMCVNRDDCYGCPYFITKCSFGEPKPKTWFDEDTIETPSVSKKALFFTEGAGERMKESAEIVELPKAQEEPVQPKADDDSEGTWLVSTSMGSVFSKYVFICSKCGYKKESFLSMTPMSYCPECEKRKANQQ